LDSEINDDIHYQNSKSSIKLDENTFRENTLDICTPKLDLRGEAISAFVSYRKDFDVQYNMIYLPLTFFMLVSVEY
jgi:hypothetical protein